MADKVELKCSINKNNKRDLFIEDIVSRTKEKYGYSSNSEVLKHIISCFYRLGGLELDIQEVLFQVDLKKVSLAEPEQAGLEESNNFLAESGEEDEFFDFLQGKI